MGGEHATYAGDAIAAGIAGKGAFSVGYSGFKTDGFRTNPDQDDQIFDVFGQYDLTPQASVQAEYRHRKTKTGDLALRFFADAFSPGERDNTETDTGRVGFRYTFSPSSIVLASVIYQDSKASVTDDSLGDPVTLLKLTKPERSVSSEVQYLFRSPKFNLVSGAGYADVKGHLDTTVDFFVPPPMVRVTSKSWTRRAPISGISTCTRMATSSP